MTEVISSRDTVALTERELSYLQKFLDANDRAGFYLAYQALVVSETDTRWTGSITVSGASATCGSAASAPTATNDNGASRGTDYSLMTR